MKRACLLLLFAIFLLTACKSDPGQEFSLEHDGLERKYFVHVSSTYTKDVPTPVVFVLHGGSGHPGAVEYQSGMNQVADKEGFIVVYPAGSHPVFKDRLLNWNDGRTAKNKEKNEVDDVGFINAVLDDLPNHFTLDRKRIYATGISNGGLMSFRLASELSQRVAAVAPIAAPRTPDEYYASPTRPIAVMYFHGVQDTYAPYKGGSPERSAFTASFLSAEEIIQAWVEHNGCPSTYTIREKEGGASRVEYSPCKEGTEVVFWKLEDGGHTWPGGKKTKSEDKARVGNVNQDVIASQLMWEFFQKHSLP